MRACIGARMCMLHVHVHVSVVCGMCMLCLGYVMCSLAHTCRPAYASGARARGARRARVFCCSLSDCSVTSVASAPRRCGKIKSKDSCAWVDKVATSDNGGFVRNTAA